MNEHCLSFNKVEFIPAIAWGYGRSRGDSYESSYLTTKCESNIFLVYLILATTIRFIIMNTKIVIDKSNITKRVDGIYRL
jgi:hypothetical protein